MTLTKKIKTLEKRIRLYQNYSYTRGQWAFYKGDIMESAETIEKSTHELLKEKLDTLAPLGEIFNGSTNEAEEAISSVFKNIRNR